MASLSPGAEHDVRLDAADLDAIEALYDERRAAFLDQSRLSREHRELTAEHSRLQAAARAIEQRLAGFDERLDAARQRVDRIQALLRAIEHMS